MRDITKLFSYASGLKKYLIFISIASVVVVGLSLVYPFILKFATDQIVDMTSGKISVDFTPILVAMSILFIVYIISDLLKDVNGYFGDILAVKLRHQLSRKYFQHMLTLPQSYFDEEVTGKIINRLNRAITEVTNFINIFSNNLFQLLLSILISVGIMAYYSPLIAIIILIQVPIYLYITAKTSKKWQKYEKDKNHNFDIASGRFTEAIEQIRMIKSFGSSNRELKMFNSRFNKMISITKKQSSYWHKMNFLRMIVQSVVYICVFLIMFDKVLNKAITIGDLVLLLTLIQQTINPIKNISFFVDMYQRAAANSKDYDESMQVQPETNLNYGKKSLDAKNKSIKFEDIDFAYNQKDGKVLRDISFEIKPGEKVALVGESGGGKSTIANLLMRLYKPDEGKIVIGNEDISEIKNEALRSQIATVFQESALFSGTIRENIVYGRPDASDNEIKKAAKSANALDFINKLDKGLDTEIGERGIKLSGGQKQRISIARAILKDSPILILDEATSALDSRSEIAVQDALEKLMKGRTVLIIAHRLSTIANVDKIVTLKDGKIDEIGSPKELAKTDGIYAQLLKIQSDSMKKSIASFDKLENFDIAS